MGALPKSQMTNAEYQAQELVAEVKHEYLRGEVWAMAGGTVQLASINVAVRVDAVHFDPTA